MMGIYEFGEKLIKTRDLDPVYVGLYGAKLPRRQLRRWLLSYLCFYHVGAASWLSEQEGDLYWTWMAHAATNDEEMRPAPVGGRWPRAAERRHFRGQKCVDAVGKLSGREPEWYFGLFDSPLRITQAQVMKEVASWPMFGDWAAFKAADLVERVLAVPMTVEPNIGLIYSEPRKELDILAEETGASAESVYNTLLAHFSIFPAPPRGERPCGPLEIETVSCKHHSHRHGHYTVGKDILEVRHALVGWGETATKLLKHMPEEV